MRKRKVASIAEALSDSDVHELEKIDIRIAQLNTNFNILAYLENIFNENVWSRVFAFLLSSEEKHELGSKLFNYWINNICKENNDILIHFKSLIRESPTKIITNIEWSTAERRRLDLLIELYDQNNTLVGVIGLENKVDSGEQEEQLSDYQNAIANTFPNIPQMIIFCTPNGRKSKTAILNHEKCPCYSITYTSFQITATHFSNKVEDELRLILKSTSDYIELMLLKERKKQILSQINIQSMPFQLRNQYSPVIPFFNTLEEYFRNKNSFPFKNWWFKSFGTQYLHFFIEEMRYKDFIPCYMICCLKREPRCGDHYLIRLLIHSQRLYKLHKQKNTRKEMDPIIDEIYTNLKLENNRNKLRHWHPWVNLWTSEKFQLMDLDSLDRKNMLNHLQSAINETFEEFKLKYNKYIKTL